MQADSLINDGTTRKLDEQHIIDLVSGQLPFALVDLPKLIKGPGGNINRSVTAEQSAITYAEAAKKAEVDAMLKTYNKDRKLLPAPPLVTDVTTDDEGNPVSTTRPGNVL